MVAVFQGHAMSKWAAALGLVMALLFAGRASGQAEDKEPSAIFEAGGAGQWGLKGGSSYGPSVAVETTPIPDVLEVEGGTTALFSRGQTEWDTDFLFKKPFTLSDTVEFMFGVGPEWAHIATRGRSSDTVAGEAALDFMFWPWQRRRFGLYLEPSYDYSFAPGHEQSVSISGGLLIPFP
jgi:hypothetical protein